MEWVLTGIVILWQTVLLLRYVHVVVGLQLFGVILKPVWCIQLNQSLVENLKPIDHQLLYVVMIANVHLQMTRINGKSLRGNLLSPGSTSCLGLLQRAGGGLVPVC